MCSWVAWIARQWASGFNTEALRMGERIANHRCQFAAIQNDGALSYCVLAARLSML